ncbi:MAG: Secretion system C-terminal sorting domain [Bacteroidota bacterium]|jgi:hypothetical protein
MGSAIHAHALASASSLQGTFALEMLIKTQNMNMKHFLSFSSSVARLSKAVQCLLLLTLVPTMHLLAGGGFVPVQMPEGTVNLFVQAGHAFNHPAANDPVHLSANETKSGQAILPSNAPLIHPPFPAIQRYDDNISRDNVRNDNIDNVQEFSLLTNPTFPNALGSTPIRTDPKVDIEINIRIDLKDINRLNDLDSDLPYRNPSATISQPVPQLENIGLQALAEPESAEIASKTFAPNTDLLELVAWPNPSFGQFQATFKGENQGRMTYRIVNLSGQTIQMRESESSTVSFDLTGYPAGSYWLQVMQGDVKLATQIRLDR